MSEITDAKKYCFVFLNENNIELDIFEYNFFYSLYIYHKQFYLIFHKNEYLFDFKKKESVQHSYSKDI
jgi:hypothetical protein